MLFISICYLGCAYIEFDLDRIYHTQHLVFDALALSVLCLIYFSTIVDLIRKLRIFVLEETKKEARLVRVQFIIFLVAYGSKVITLMVWIKNPPLDRTDIQGFLINVDVMEIVWVFLPCSFVFCMQIRSFRKMREEKLQLLLEVHDQQNIEHPEDTTA